VTVERQSEEDFLRYAFMYEARHVLKPELPVVIRMPYQAASLSFQDIEKCKALQYKGGANALPLVIGQHRNRSRL
jgi:hypothetical protein